MEYNQRQLKVPSFLRKKRKAASGTKKKPRKKAAKSTRPAASSNTPSGPEKATSTLPIGKVTHYLENIQVAILKLNHELEVGQTVEFQSEEPFEQEIESMQVNREEITKAGPGQFIGIKVVNRVQPGTIVLLK
ncbi:MAG: hypothetical protein COU09_01245 [Candidatus Harrisonbacteria bacterium CG10_big_fil_rev_8_21_14_0_10_44_23]|uniref:Translation elongation factor-like protein n=1 Tax=Candidatus Harrisonbacteria bacterium CG10_big_fil_rev_8_21_14_0_10_44_23 TaxID=1974585 RepID=A0A2H0UQ80_9BACT|nr:MAG: hypothetical protein COU09_01245 [Candidatus Harrisonbacteria bacterium CG10_big_fil_rev_8_21_14_0_10_44_23]